MPPSKKRASNTNGKAEGKRRKKEKAEESDESDVELDGADGATGSSEFVAEPDETSNDADSTFVSVFLIDYVINLSNGTCCVRLCLFLM
jgi:hypothetical protein